MPRSQRALDLLVAIVLLFVVLLILSAPRAHAETLQGQSCNTGPCRLTHISTNASTQVCTGACFVHTITINTKGASVNVATVYDDTDCSTAPVLAIIDTTAGPTWWLFDGVVKVGLCVKTATGTAADMTVSAR